MLCRIRARKINVYDDHNVRISEFTAIHECSSSSIDDFVDWSIE